MTKVKGGVFLIHRLFLNHPSFNPELILGMEEELAERVYFHTPSAELFRALFNTGNINLDQLCGCMKNRKNEPGAPNYLAFVEYMLTQNKLRSVYLKYLSNVEPSVYSAFLAEAGVTPSNFEAELAEVEQKIIDKGIAVMYGFFVAVSQDCPSHIADFQNQLIGDWREDYRQELSSIPDFNELFQNTSLDNFNFPCAELGFNYLFSLLNSDNSANLRSTLINQVQGAGITTLQQKKNWLIDWYFSNDPMGSIYLATLRNSALVSTYQTNPGMLYGTPFASGMENYFQKIKNYFGQSMFDQLVTEFAQQSNLYVDEIKVDEYGIYGSSRLGIYEANKTLSRRVARDLNNDNQISNNEYVVETPEEVLYLFSSYQLERGAKRYELANHLGNVLTVISDKKTANFTGSTFTHFTAERISATDYSPFGAPLAGRTWNGGEYRFGFNGQENMSQVYGEGNFQDFRFRSFSARLGRFIAVDPLANLYPYFSTYQFAGNTPIWALDLEGLEPWFTNQPMEYNGDASLPGPIAYGPLSVSYSEIRNLSPLPVIDFQKDVLVYAASDRSGPLDRAGFEFSLEGNFSSNENGSQGEELVCQFYGRSENGMDYNLEVNSYTNTTYEPQKEDPKFSASNFVPGANITMFFDFSGDKPRDYQFQNSNTTMSFEPFVKTNASGFIMEYNYSTRELKFGFGTPSLFFETGIKVKSNEIQISNDPVFEKK